MIFCDNSLFLFDRVARDSRLRRLVRLAPFAHRREGHVDWDGFLALGHPRGPCISGSATTASACALVARDSCVRHGFPQDIQRGSSHYLSS